MLLENGRAAPDLNQQLIDYESDSHGAGTALTHMASTECYIYKEEPHVNG